jgi:dipeptidyl aminopeptidase/acylaminoacyl peptidase
MPRSLVPEDLYALRMAEDPQLSPDGERVAYIVTSFDRPTYEYRRTIWVAPVAGGEPRQFTSGPNDTAPRWSPDGRQLAFVRAPARKSRPKDAAERDRGVGKPQVWVLPVLGGEARQLTFERYGAGSATWSPDSASIVYVARRGAPDDPEAEDAALDGHEVPAVRTFERLMFRHDGQGWTYEQRSHLFNIPASGGEARQLTDGDWDDSAPAWSPNGQTLAFTSDRSAERWRWPGSDIWILDLASGELRRLTNESLQCGAAAWSPDGAAVAFAAAPRRRSGGHVDLYIAPAGGREGARRLTDDFVPTCADTCIDDMRAGHGPSRPIWSPDGQRIYFLASYRGSTSVFAAPRDGSEPELVTQGNSHVYAFSADAPGRTLALGISDEVTPGDLAVQPLDASGESQPRRLTELNADLFAQVSLARPEEFTFRSADDWSLQGWVMRPARAEPEQDIPAVLQIHGGPHSMYGYSFFFEFQLLAARGYAVVYSNPRGSTGYGRVFSDAVTNDWGGKDYEDIMAGLDAAIARGGIDPERLAVAGGSYGGYMTNWVVGHTDRFKAAVTMRCLSNFASFFGTSDIGWDFTVDQLDATPWDNPDKLLHHSPIKYVANIHTPLLILHSDNDLRCPIGEGEQLFTALQYLGREVKLVRFEGQTHDLSRNGHPRSRVVRLQHIVRWLEDHVPVEAPVPAS